MFHFRSQAECIVLIQVFGMTRLGIEPQFPVLRFTH